MNILIIAVSDDNYGDTVIRVCFNKLMKVVLKNLSISDYHITNIAMNRIDENIVKQSDIIYFAGGGIIKYDYLRFYEYIDNITELADNYNIPVVFSSVGIESYNEEDEKCMRLKKAIRRKCVKSISVRDDIDSLEKYLIGTEIERSQVCDPAVWTPFAYNIEKKEDRNIIGINVVRSGLFKANEKNWNKQDEMDFLVELKKLLDQNNLQYKFFTNGSFLDEHFLRDFKSMYDIPDEQVILNMNNSQRLVEEISSFKGAVTFRMHAGIIAYSFGIPSVSLAWNDKLTFFYNITGLADRVFQFDDWKAGIIFDKIYTIMNVSVNIEKCRTSSVRQNETDTDAMQCHQEFELSREHGVKCETYNMSVYKYLYNSVTKHCKNKVELPQDVRMYTFTKVKEEMLSAAEDLLPYNNYDTMMKITRGGERYLARIQELIEKNNKISENEDCIKEYKRQIKEQKDRIKEYKDRTKEYKEQIIDYKKEISGYKKNISALKKQVNEFNRMFIIRCINYLKRKKKTFFG